MSKPKKYNSIKDTAKHMNLVNKTIYHVMDELNVRACTHDYSKTMPPEVEIFDEYTPKLKDSTYGSDEYKSFLAEMRPALEHHYQNNRHHPEHYPDGLRGMNLVDLVEMFCDWYAAAQRHDNGDILKSIELNATRFEYDDLLKSIFINTAHFLKEQEE